MKNFYFTAKILLLSLAFFSLQANAQAPQTITYQSVIRNSSNALLANTAVGIKISILQGSSTGTEAYAETQTATTNTNGLVSLQIGNGTPTTGTTFAGIDWAAGPYFIKTETDPTGGSNYTITGIQQMASVPYALYAAKSGGTVFEPTNDMPDAIHNTNQGNVGIGTDLPGEKLDVAGNLKVRGTLNNMNVGNLGVGGDNVVFGNSAYNSGASGNNNTANGARALALNTTGSDNTANGKEALYSNATGIFNTANGGVSLYNNTIGDGNTANGLASLAGNTVGNYNTANGFQALLSNTTGSNNSAFGNSADVATGDLSNATAIGSGAIVNASNQIQLGNTDVTTVNTSGTYTGAGFKTPNGTATEFLMADGSTSAGQVDVITAMQEQINALYEKVVFLTPIQTNTIGSQDWTTTNLSLSFYSDGTLIPQVTDPTAWANLTTGAWCYYNNDPATGATYGKLYNWYAVSGIWNESSKTDTSQRKKLAPTGYHVPSDYEWGTLYDDLGGEQIAGGKMKETDTTHWTSPNTDATNSSGFTALPGGHRDNDGSFILLGSNGYWWTSNDVSTSMTHFRYLNNDDGIARGNVYFKTAGFSVRCVKD